MTCARGLSAALAVRCVGLPSYHSCFYSESERAGQPIEDIVRLGSWIGIGGRLSAPLLPNHLAYGSRTKAVRPG